MTKKSKIFFVIFFFLIFASIAVSFYKYFVLKDYYVKTEVECNPEQEKCFIAECDPVLDSECSENPNERISYYKLVQKKPSAVSLCDADSPDCQPFACQAGEDCQEILCDQEAAQTEGVECNDPETYIKEQINSINSQRQINQENPKEQIIEF